MNPEYFENYAPRHESAAYLTRTLLFHDYFSLNLNKNSVSETVIAFSFLSRGSRFKMYRKKTTLKIDFLWKYVRQKLLPMTLMIEQRFRVKKLFMDGKKCAHTIVKQMHSPLRLGYCKSKLFLIICMGCGASEMGLWCPWGTGWEPLDYVQCDRKFIIIHKVINGEWFYLANVIFLIYVLNLDRESYPSGTRATHE